MKSFPGLMKRRDFWYLRKHIPEQLRPFFGGKKDVWKSLGTQDRRKAERNYHAVMDKFHRELDEAQRQLDALTHEEKRMASPQADALLSRFSILANQMQLPVGTFAPPVRSPEDEDYVRMALTLGQVSERPTSKGEAIKLLEKALKELEWERENAVHLSLGNDADGQPHWVVPVRYVPSLEEWVDSQFAATRRTLEAIKAEFEALGDESSASKPDDNATGAEGAGLKELVPLWERQRKHAASTHNDMRTAISRFARVNGPLPYREISVEHVRRYKTDILGDTTIKNSTKQKLWRMVRTLMKIASEDARIESDPFDKIKIGMLGDDTSQREDLTASDLKALFSHLKGDEWWLVRVCLYSGARLGEICQLTKGDIIEEEGVASIFIRDSEEDGKTVKTRNSVRKVPIHKQLLADGFLEWVDARPTDNLLPWKSSVASKRLLRRFQELRFGEGKVVHSLRHTFISAARKVMDEEHRDRITGHKPQKIGRTYGSFPDLKSKIDLVAFGLETG